MEAQWKFVHGCPFLHNIRHKDKDIISYTEEEFIVCQTNIKMYKESDKYINIITKSGENIKVPKVGGFEHNGWIVWTDENNVNLKYVNDNS